MYEGFWYSRGNTFKPKNIEITRRFNNVCANLVLPQRNGYKIIPYFLFLVVVFGYSENNFPS